MLLIKIYVIILSSLFIKHNLCFQERRREATHKGEISTAYHVAAIRCNTYLPHVLFLKKHHHIFFHMNSFTRNIAFDITEWILLFSLHYSAQRCIGIFVSANCYFDKGTLCMLHMLSITCRTLPLICMQSIIYSLLLIIFVLFWDVKFYTCYDYSLVVIERLFHVL